LIGMLQINDIFGQVFEETPRFWQKTLIFLHFGGYFVVFMPTGAINLGYWQPTDITNLA